MSANDEFASVALVESTINESTTVSTCLRTTSLRVLHWSNQRSMNGQRRVCVSTCLRNDEFASVALVESTINEWIGQPCRRMSANDEFASVALVESTINESTTVSTCLRTTSLRVLHWSNQRSMNRQPCRRVCERRVCECCIGRINDQ